MNNTNYTYNKKILDKFNTKLNYMLDKHSRVLISRFDIRYPEYMSRQPSSKDIRTFNENLVKDLKKNYPLPQPGYIRSKPKNELEEPTPLDVQTMYVQERTSEDKHPHYHYSVMTNARQIRKEHTIHEKAKHHWNNVLKDNYQDGLVNISNQNGPSSILLDKNQTDFEVKKEQAFKQASYLAKDYSKEHNPKGSWKSGGNRIPKK